MPLDTDKFRSLLDDALRVARQTGRPARAAWLTQHMRAREPSFSLHAHGFSNFREFVEALGGYEAQHDGFDVVVSEAGSTLAAPVDLRREKVHPILWRAATRPPGAAPAYLDRQALTRGEVQVRSDRAGENWVLVPVPSQQEQANWIVAWANSMNLAEKTLHDLREAVAAGGVPRALQTLRAQPIERQFLEARIVWTKERLQQWATEVGLPWGPPLVVVPGADATCSPAQKSRGDLRSLVSAAVQHLTDEELRQLRLPVGLVYDLLKGSM